MEINMSGYNTLIIAAVIMLVGHWLVFRVKFLSDFNIPEPVVGGLLAAIFVFVLNRTTGIVLSFSSDLQTTFMLMFFGSIGLSADFARLKAGGKPLVIFLGIVSTFIVIQNTVGVSMAYMLGLQPLIVLVAGSILLTGGLGFSASWGYLLEMRYGVIGATFFVVSMGTFGLVIGGVIGGPIARYIMRRIHREPHSQDVYRITKQAVSGMPRREIGTDVIQDDKKLTI